MAVLKALSWAAKRVDLLVQMLAELMALTWGAWLARNLAEKRVYNLAVSLVVLMVEMLAENWAVSSVLWMADRSACWKVVK
eukprot:scaffold119_cov219-Ochromonas_danica.AAC.3